MGKCVVCGKPVRMFTNVHPECAAKADAADRERAQAAAPRDTTPVVVSSTPDTPAGVIACNIFGVLFLLLGLYLLVVAPGVPAGAADMLPDSLAAIRVVNFQRLAMGQAFTIAGAIFLAAAWRPRR
jgi:hypothetical protein